MFTVNIHIFSKSKNTYTYFKTIMISIKFINFHFQSILRLAKGTNDPAKIEQGIVLNYTGTALCKMVVAKVKL